MAARSTDTTSLSVNPEIIPDTKVTTTNKCSASDVTPAVTDKELSVTISSSDVQWCKPQTARRGKKMLGPNCQDDRKTLVEMKKKQSAQEKTSGQKNIIEDCQVPIDNTTYADWLLEQGIPDSIDDQDVIIVDNSQTNVVHKIEMPTGNDEVAKQVQKTDDKDINDKPSTKNEDGPTKPEKTEGKQVSFNANELVSEYVQKFQGDLNAFLPTCASKEETMERITHINEILHIMDTDKVTQVNKPSSEMKANEKEKEDIMPQVQPQKEGANDVMPQVQPEKDINKNKPKIDPSK